MMQRRFERKGKPIVYFPQGDWDNDALPAAVARELVDLARAKLDFSPKRCGECNADDLVNVDQQFKWRDWWVICNVIHPGWVDIVGFDCQKTGIRHASLEHIYCVWYGDHG
jgi:hypothetical protein